MQHVIKLGVQDDCRMSEQLRWEKLKTKQALWQIVGV
jgi:hypothetical protein